MGDLEGWAEITIESKEGKMSVFDYRKSLEGFSIYELQICQMLIDNLVDFRDSDFSYLKEVGLKDVKIYWYSDSSPQVLGGFYLLSNNCLFINREFVSDIDLNSKSGKASRILMVFPTIMHELCHFWQSRKYKWLYFLMQLPIVREFAIERQANRISDKLFEKVGLIVGSPSAMAKMKKEYGFPAEDFDDEEMQFVEVEKTTKTEN